VADSKERKRGEKPIMNIYSALAYIGVGLVTGYGAMWLYCRIKNKKRSTQ
jgi:hypothetical protein